MSFVGTFSSKGDINMAGVKETRASFEILESFDLEFFEFGRKGG